MSKPVCNVDNDEFVCEICGDVWDIDDSHKRDEMYLCPICVDQERPCSGCMGRGPNCACWVDDNEDDVMRKVA